MFGHDFLPPPPLDYDFICGLPLMYKAKEKKVKQNVIPYWMSVRQVFQAKNIVRDSKAVSRRKFSQTKLLL
jgi:hypothetical protein